MPGGFANRATDRPSFVHFAIAIAAAAHKKITRPPRGSYREERDGEQVENMHRSLASLSRIDGFKRAIGLK